MGRRERLLSAGRRALHPGAWFALGTADPAFRTKPAIALALVEPARAEGWPFRAVVADCLCGEHHGFTAGLQQRGMPSVVALKPSHAWWAPVGAVGEVAAAGGWVSAEEPGAWIAVERSFRDGHTTCWWALERIAGPYGPARPRRLGIATPDPVTLPETATWYLATTLPVAEADLVEVVRLYGRRTWVEQQDQQVKTSLGWSQYQVRSDVAMRRHWALVRGAFAFCWWAEMRTPAPPDHDLAPPRDENPAAADTLPDERGGKAPLPASAWPRPGRCWPRALRRVRAWREPAWFLWRCWRAWSGQPPPPPLQALLEWLDQGHPLSLYDSS